MSEPSRTPADRHPGLHVRESVPDRRYLAEVEGREAGVLAYRRHDDVTTFTHTVVEPAFEGQGIASALVRAALAAERAAGRQVVPQCPFVRSYLRRHPDEADVVRTGTG